MHRKLIVAAIGGKKDRAVAGQARIFGELVARENWILLTGARAKHPSDQVSQAAASGCLAEEGLLISILCDQQENKCVPTENGIEVMTRLTNYGRDPITGAAADIVVVFLGEHGTSVEVAYAALKNRPLVFYNCRESLQEFRTKNVHSLRDKLKEAVERYPLLPTTIQNLEAALDYSLKQKLYDVNSAEEAITTVREIARNIHLFGDTHFRGLPEKPIATKLEFELGAFAVSTA